jgi:hypothetical protein
MHTFTLAVATINVCSSKTMTENNFGKQSVLLKNVIGQIQDWITYILKDKIIVKFRFL